MMHDVRYSCGHSERIFARPRLGEAVYCAGCRSSQRVVFVR